MPYPFLFQPFKIKGLEIQNRILMAPMGNNLSGAQGIITPRAMAYYLERVKGGVGMVMTEAVAVSLRGRHRAGCLCLYDAAHEKGMRLLVKTIHDHGGKVAIQLNHGGRLCDPNVNGGHVVGPSEITAPPRLRPLKAMTVHEIRETVLDFARSAKSATEVGFDAIEIHGAHGYLIHQFFSPRSNRREDEYGGSVENRMRFHLEIVRAVRESVGEDLPLIFRLSAEEFEEGGYSLEEAIILGRALRDAGVDILHISAGTTERPQSSLYCIQPQALPEGCLIDFAEKFRTEVGPPVIGVGRITRPDMAEGILRDKRVDLIAMGRSLLADPGWAIKAGGASREPLRPCIACNTCLESISNQKPIICAVNPLAGSEDRLPIKRVFYSKRVAVVGTGPAGMEAACTAALLGHHVDLYEREARIGGQLWEAAVPPHKALLGELIGFYQARLRDLGVEVHLGEAFSKTTADEKAFDAVILATGSRSVRPQVPGVDQAHVHMARDVLMARSPAGQDVLVVGGGMVGCETAEFLAGKSKTVTLIEMLDEVAMDVEPRARFLLVQRLARYGVHTKTACKLKEIKADHAVVAVRDDEAWISADSVVLAVGYHSDNELEAQLEGGSQQVYPIGDCVRTGNIREAIRQGFWVVYENLGSE
jgi:2,4-dienoyl-CoA reductase-like NADH-dependent reductase (Old Yellow Enzyme family)/thioredoxin reductase